MDGLQPLKPCKKKKKKLSLKCFPKVFVSDEKLINNEFVSVGSERESTEKFT